MAHTFYHELAPYYDYVYLYPKFRNLSAFRAL